MNLQYRAYINFE